MVSNIVQNLPWQSANVEAFAEAYSICLSNKNVKAIEFLESKKKKKFSRTKK